MSPTARSLAEMRRLGWTAGVVERWIERARVRVDLFGCIDILGMMEHGRLIGVQACAGASHAARRAKAIAEPRLSLWLRCGALFEIWSWRLAGERGKRKTWTLRRDSIGPDDIAAAKVSVSRD